MMGEGILWIKNLIWVSDAWSPGEAAASSRDARQRPRRPPVTHGQVGASHLWTLNTNFAFCILHSAFCILHFAYLIAFIVLQSQRF